MDHYCPFVLCTIGHSNHAQFLLICFYHSVGISLGFFGFFKWLYTSSASTLHSLSFASRLSFILFLLVDFVAIVSLLTFCIYMLFYNIKFIRGNLTTLDWYKERADQVTREGYSVSGRIRSRLLTDVGVFDFGVFHNLRAFGLDDWLFWLPKRQEDFYEGYYYPQLDRPSESVPFRPIEGLYFTQEDGSKIYFDKLEEAKKQALKAYKGKTMLYPGNYQKLIE